MTEFDEVADRRLVNDFRNSGGEGGNCCARFPIFPKKTQLFSLTACYSSARQAERLCNQPAAVMGTAAGLFALI
jgi:hypothetical protein